jgi:hypothetical protein
MNPFGTTLATTWGNQFLLLLVLLAMEAFGWILRGIEFFNVILFFFTLETDATN